MWAHRGKGPQCRDVPVIYIVFRMSRAMRSGGVDSTASGAGCMHVERYSGAGRDSSGNSLLVYLASVVRDDPDDPPGIGEVWSTVRCGERDGA